MRVCAGSVVQAFAERLWCFRIYLSQLLNEPATECALLRACEAAKRILCRASAATVELKLPSGTLLSVRITRQKLASLLTHLLSLVISQLETLMREVSWSVAELTGVIVCGGTCAIPCVQERLSEFFRREVLTLVSPLCLAPSFAATRGATIRSALACDRGH